MNSGQRISHYEIAEKLGEGGMGVVYKAWDTKLGRFVALKFLPSHMARSEAQVSRLQQEARAFSALNHPNIATIYEIGESEGQYFLALEYLPGGTLKSALENLRGAGQQMSIEQALEYSQQIAEALAHAHAHNVIHRDVKAGNMLFSGSGSLKMTDFGLAKLAEGVDLTQTGSVLGTPATMSPEQAQGEEADPRSDIFSAGVTIFELFAGELPFRGATPAVMLHQVIYTPAPALSEFRSGIPVALERIVAKALAKQREERYQTAAELAGDLRVLRRELLLGSVTGRSALETVTIAAVPTRRRRSPVLVAAACLAGGLVALGTGWVAWPVLRESVATGAGWLPAWMRPPEKRLAILPFDNTGGDPKYTAYVGGLREVLTSQLTEMERVGGSLVVVVAPEEVKKKEITTAAEAGRRLGANLVMAGKLVQNGQQPLLIVELEDPQSPEVLRSASIDMSHPDVMAAAEKAVQLLKLELSSGTRKALEAANSADAEATHDYIEGRGYLSRADRIEDLELALRDFRDAVARDPNYALAHAALAEAGQLKYKFQKNEASLAEAEDHGALGLRLNPRLAAVHQAMAQVRLRQGRNEEALRELEAAQKIEPANATTLRLLGQVHEAMGQYPDAETTYKNALEVRPGDIAAHLNLGTFYFNRRNWPDAERIFRRAFALAPDNYWAHNDLGGVFFRMERYADAVVEFRKSVAIAPNAPGYNNLGTSYYYGKDYLRAAEAFAQARDLEPDDPKRWASLADAYRSAPGLKAQAGPAYLKAIELAERGTRRNSRDAELLAGLATYRVYFPAQRAQARTDIEKALALDPNAAVQFDAAVVFAQTGEQDRALDHLERAIAGGARTRNQILASPTLDGLQKYPRFHQMMSTGVPGSTATKP